MGEEAESHDSDSSGDAEAEEGDGGRDEGSREEEEDEDEQDGGEEVGRRIVAGRERSTAADDMAECERRAKGAGGGG